MKHAISFLLGAIFATVGIAMFSAQSPEQVATFTGTNGTTNSTQKIATLVGDGGEAATTTNSKYVYGSLLNGTANDWVVQDVFFYIDGMETNQQITMLAGTSTTAVGTSTVVAAFMSTIVPTSSPSLYYASTTASNSYASRKIWPAGTYMNFIASSSVPTATTTSNANIVVGVRYITE